MLTVLAVAAYSAALVFSAYSIARDRPRAAGAGVAVALVIMAGCAVAGA